MMSSLRRTLAAAVIALAPTSILAQLPTCGVYSTIGVSVGMAKSDRVDETISPAQFQGLGPQFSLATQHALRGMCLGASLRGAAATLSAMGGSAASETLAEGD